jgi:hypothetical protein
LIVIIINMNLKFESLKPTQKYDGLAREGHSVTFLPKLNALLIFGGTKTSEVHLFNLSSQ